jgi:hypothetical protein
MRITVRLEDDVASGASPVCGVMNRLEPAR